MDCHVAEFTLAQARTARNDYLFSFLFFFKTQRFLAVIIFKAARIHQIWFFDGPVFILHSWPVIFFIVCY